MNVSELHRYEDENIGQPEAETDPFTIERYQQFARHLPVSTRVVLDVGCCTGRGGREMARRRPDIELWGVDVVRDRLDMLPHEYEKRLQGLSTDLPIDDGVVDAVVAGEFLEHLTPRDVDPTLFEFHRVLRVGGLLMMTTPNPAYLRLRLTGMTVYGPGHLTQHHVRSLRDRLRMHGFGGVCVRGSGKVSRYLGEHVPYLPLYGSYLITARKF